MAPTLAIDEQTIQITEYKTWMEKGFYYLESTNLEQEQFNAIRKWGHLQFNFPKHTDNMKYIKPTFDYKNKISWGEKQNKIRPFICSYEHRYTNQIESHPTFGSYGRMHLINGGWMYTSYRQYSRFMFQNYDDFISFKMVWC